MKKTLLSLVGLALAFGLFGSHANAITITELLDGVYPQQDGAYSRILTEYETSRGYLDPYALTCNSDNSISIVAPIVENSYDVENAATYRLYLSPYRIDQLRSNDLSVDYSRIIMKEVNLTNDMNEITFNISENDVDPNASYYGFIVPIDERDEVGTPSGEICFHLNKNLCMLNDECNTFDLVVNPVTAEPTPVVSENSNEGTEETHGAASCAGMELAHVSHTTDGKNVTLTWTTVDGEDVEIAILNPDEEIYEKLATVKMSDEKYTYALQWSGEQNFMFTTDCGIFRYKADAAIKQEKTPEKIVTPATGPAENILYIAIAAIVLYGAYVIFFRKADNKE